MLTGGSAWCASVSPRSSPRSRAPARRSPRGATAAWWLTCGAVTPTWDGAGHGKLTAWSSRTRSASRSPRCARCGWSRPGSSTWTRRLRDTRKKLAAAVRASRTTLTEVFGVGPVIAGTIIGDASGVARFPGRDHFAAYNGTAPVGVPSGNRKVHRLSLRGNRPINHAIHMAAITQISHKHSPGRAYYDKKIAEGRTRKDALRSLKRRISDAIYARLQADARQAAKASEKGPGGQPGNDSDSSAAGSHPERQLFGQATPGPDTTIRPAARAKSTPRSKPISKKTRPAA